MVLLSNFLSIKPARHGKGLFATRDIAVGTLILSMRGPVISYTQVLHKRNPDNAFQISMNRYIDLRSPSVYGNHSCSPNAGVTPNLMLVAIKNIKRGQEVRYDYSTCMDYLTECEFPCECGARNCRKIIRGFSTLPRGLQSLYIRLGIVQKFLLK